MSNVKTAVSIEEGLYKQIETAASEMNVSRSHFFALAAKDFLRRRENQHILEKLNEVYSEPDPEDQQLLEGMKHLYRRVLEREGDEW